MARPLPTSTAHDVIVAPATAPGAAAIAIVRVGGDGALDVAARVFRGGLRDAPPATMVLGELHHPTSRETIDRPLAVRWAAPRSYTGEDMVEFHLHGSPAIVRRTIEALVAAGAREAQPGEFTRRAYLNGKVDLAQAEAIAELTRSRTDEAGRAALALLSGGLAKALSSVRNPLIQTTAELEAWIDYPEEDIPAPDMARLTIALGEAASRLRALERTFTRGRHLVGGARVVLAGPPNAGKSSLFNALLGRERAIVSPHPGTTRDTIECTIDLGGIPVTLVDTAGLRAMTEEIESAGIAKSLEEVQSASFVLFVVDARSAMPADAREHYGLLREVPHFLVFNKAGEDGGLDDGPKWVPAPGWAAELFISVRDRRGLEDLETRLLAALAGPPGFGESTVILTNARQHRAVVDALAHLESAGALLVAGRGVELVVTELIGALAGIDGVLGIGGNLDEEILDAVFRTFCLGK